MNNEIEVWDMMLYIGLFLVNCFNLKFKQ